MQQSKEYYGKGSLAEEFDFGMFEHGAWLDKKAQERAETRNREKREAARQAKMKENRAKQAEQGRRHNQVLTIVDKYGRFQVAAVIFAAVLFIVLLAMMVANGQKVNDLTHDIKDKKAEITVLEQDYEVMKIAFESKMSDAAIEQYAIKELGMQRRENYQTEWLSINNSDVFESCGNGHDGIFFWNNH